MAAVRGVGLGAALCAHLKVCICCLASLAPCHLSLGEATRTGSSISVPMSATRRPHRAKKSPLPDERSAVIFYAEITSRVFRFLCVLTPTNAPMSASTSYRRPISYLRTLPCSLIIHTRTRAHTRQLTAKWLFIKDRDLRGSNRLRDGNCVSH